MRKPVDRHRAHHERNANPSTTCGSKESAGQIDPVTEKAPSEVKSRPGHGGENKKFFTVRQIADLLQLKTTIIYDMIKGGEPACLPNERLKRLYDQT